MILLTGGAGFIGSHILDALIAEGHEVRVLDGLLATAGGRWPDYMRPEAELIEGYMANRSVVARALRGVSAVCHQAAMVGLGQDMLDVAEYARHNDLGTAILLRELAASGFKGRLVLASSMVVYGEGGYRCPQHGAVSPAPRAVADLVAGVFEPGCPRCESELKPIAIDESAPLDPRSVYAATKVHQEHLERLHGACPIVGSYGARDRSLPGRAARLEQALTELGVPHDVK